jgi:hypothetical protein
MDRISLQYAPNANETSERLTRTIRKTHDTRNERTIHEKKRTIHERTNEMKHYSKTNDPGSIEVQYSIVLLLSPRQRSCEGI